MPGRNTSPERIELLAKNHKVNLLGDKILCQDCGTEWPRDTSRWDWWLCPDLCNLSQKAAMKIIHEVGTGSRQASAELLQRCQDRLLTATKHPRAAWNDAYAEAEDLKRTAMPEPEPEETPKKDWGDISKSFGTGDPDAWADLLGEET